MISFVLSRIVVHIVIVVGRQVESPFAQSLLIYLDIEYVWIIRFALL
jgi:hypothetical protein